VRVFETLPADSINSNIASTFVPMAKPEKKSADELRAVLRQKVFSGWPEENAPPEPKFAFESKQDNLRLRAWDFVSQHDVTLRLYLLDDAGARQPEAISLTVLDPSGAMNWLADVRALAGGQAQFSENLAGEFTGANLPVADGAALEKMKREVLEQHCALAFFAPRGVGLTAWSGGEKRLTQIRRRFMLLGQTLDGMRVWDIRRAIQTIGFMTGPDSARIELRTDGGEAVNSLYAALFEPVVTKFDATGIPKSHMDSAAPDYLGVLKFTDIPEVTAAVAKHAKVEMQSSER
jgi:hypothetical protein